MLLRSVRTDRAWRRGAAVVLAAALLLRLAPMAAHLFREDRVTTVDSAAYLELAGRLRDAGDFSPGGRPETFRTPGYPLFLAPLLRLPGGPLPWALTLQALLGTGLAAAALVLAREWGTRAASLAAGALLAVDPGHLVAANLVMSDVLAAAAVAGAFVLAERGRTAAALASGLLLAAATAVRPVVLPLVLPWSVLLARRRGLPRRVVAAAAALALAFPAAWTVRNGLAAGRWTVSGAFDLNLGLVLAAKIVARGQGVGLDEARARLAAAGAVFDPGADAAVNRRIAARAVAEHPGAAAAELALSLAEMLLAGERRQALRLIGSPRGDDRVASLGEAARSEGAGAALDSASAGELVLVGAQLAFNAAVLLLAGAGALRLWRSGERLAVGVAVSAVALVLAPSLVVATGRMRLPVSLFLAVLAGIALGGARSRTGDLS